MLEFSELFQFVKSFIFLNTIFLVSLERPLYLRESMNKSYSSGPYFLGKSIADLPF